MRRIAIAQNTIEIIDTGHYISPSGKQVNIKQELQSCLAETKYYEPDTLEKIEQEVISSNQKYVNTDFEVVKETTLMGQKEFTKLKNSTKLVFLILLLQEIPVVDFSRLLMHRKKVLHAVRDFIKVF
jgi:uncharacterized protein (TIGR02452 family)